MLSEAERRSLEQIEQQLRAEEPALARTMTSARKPMSWLFLLILTIFGGLTVLLLVIAAVGAAFQCLLVTVATIVLHRHPIRLRG